MLKTYYISIYIYTAYYCIIYIYIFNAIDSRSKRSLVRFLVAGQYIIVDFLSK